MDAEKKYLQDMVDRWRADPQEPYCLLCKHLKTWKQICKGENKEIDPCWCITPDFVKQWLLSWVLKPRHPRDREGAIKQKGIASPADSAIATGIFLESQKFYMDVQQFAKCNAKYD